MGLDTGDNGEAVFFERSLEEKGRRLPKTVPGNRPFLVGHLPTHWEFLPETGEWLPGIREFEVVPGVNGVRTDGKPDPIMGLIASKGGVVVSDRDTRLPDEFRPVMRRRYNTKGKAVHYPCWVEWEQDYLGAERRKVGDAHVRFRRALRESGIVEPMNAMVRRRAVRDAEKTFNMLRDMHGSSPANAGLAEKVEGAHARWVAMRDGITLDEALASIRPKPASRRGGKATA